MLKKIFSFFIFTFILFSIPNFTFAQECDPENSRVTCTCGFSSAVTATDANINFKTLDRDQWNSACSNFCSNHSSFEEGKEWKILCNDNELGSGSIVKIAEEEEVRPVTAPPVLSIPLLNFVNFSPAAVEGGNLRINYIGQYVQALFNFLLILASLASVVTIMVAGLTWMTARGNATKVGNAKSLIGKSLFTILILLFSYTILSLVDSRLVTTDGILIRRIDPIPFTENTGADVSALNLPPPSGGTKNVPYFSQRDFNQRYGECSDGQGGFTTIRSSGCGPTSFAMVLRHFEVNTDPVQVAQVMVDEGHRICGRGTNAYGFTSSSLIRDNNLESQALASNSAEVFEDALKDGSLLIISVGPSRFTRSGHFMVITGMESEGGQFLINDPNSGFQNLTRQEANSIVKHTVRINRKSN